MKHLYPSLQAKKYFVCMQHVILSVAFSLIVLFSFSQKLSQEYIFNNPVLESGVTGQDGAVYRFSNVAKNIDALVTINARSSSLVTLDSVDVTSTGYDKAFQPLVTYNGGTAQGPVSWWMEFVVSFVKSGKNSAVNMDSLKVTALDVDGDNSTLQEQFTAFGASNYTVNSPTNLSIGSVTGGTQFTGPVLNSTNIDTSAINVMVTLTYLNQNSITFRYGGQVTSASSSGAANRFNSIWFKAFNYNSTPFLVLPIDLVSFNAQLNNNSRVMLDWVTSGEINASHFMVQRSIDGNAFTDEASIFTEEGNSSTNRQYAYADDVSQVTSNFLYYRLKMVDKDGRYKYSNIALINIGVQQESLALQTYPNPAVNQISITLPREWQNSTIAYSMYNLSGNLIKQKTNSNAGQTETFNIANLPLGLYIIEVANGKKTLTQKFIKKS